MHDAAVALHHVLVEEHGLGAGNGRSQPLKQRVRANENNSIEVHEKLAKGEAKGVLDQVVEQTGDAGERNLKAGESVKKERKNETLCTCMLVMARAVNTSWRARRPERSRSAPKRGDETETKKERESFLAHRKIPVGNCVRFSVNEAKQTAGELTEPGTCGAWRTRKTGLTRSRPLKD